MSIELWQANNRQEVLERIKWLESKPQGVIYDRKLSQNRIVIKKRGSEISLHFADSQTNELSGIMSEIDLEDPFKLIFGYTRALMLPLVWISEPKRVYMVGFGGGRVPMILHHYFPELVIESTEIDPDIPFFAERYFGIHLDQRQKVIFQDGREYLASRSPGNQYDFIMVDAFGGSGYIPYHLSTIDFYDLCKMNLVNGGVVATNLGVEDPLYRQRINTIDASFEHIYLLDYDTAKIVLGTNGTKLGKSEIVERVNCIEKQYQLSFPLLPSALELKTASEIPEYLAQFGYSTEILVDEPPRPVLEDIPLTNTIFANFNGNNPCPCGSGKKFMHCHSAK